MASFEDFDPAEALARWLAEQKGGPPVRFEKVELGDEQILEGREQRELDALPSALAVGVLPGVPRQGRVGVGSSTVHGTSPPV